MTEQRNRRQMDEIREKREQRKAELREMKRRRTLFIVCFGFIFAIVIGVIVYSEVEKYRPEQAPSIPVESSVTIPEDGILTTASAIVAVPEEETSEIETTDETTIEETTLEETTETESIEETSAPETQVAETPAEETAAPEGHYNDIIYIPSWVTQDFLPFSEFCRGGEKLGQVNNIVIHYVGNTGSSAKANRDYFADLANPQVNTTGHGASSHFVVGLEGEVIQCVPVNEVAFANYPRNYDTVSIENCHPGDDGKFNEKTYGSLVRLTAYLCQQLGVPTSQIIRHHDVTGKMCPLYYVEHADEWEQFKVDVQNYLDAHPDIRNEQP